MFDDIFGKKKKKGGSEVVNYDKTDEFHSVIEPVLDSLMEASRDILNIPIIVIACLSHKETQKDSHTEGEAQIMVATHGRRIEDNEVGGGKWYPGIMNVMMELLTNPELLRTIADNMEAIRAMSQGRGRAINLDSIDPDQIKRSLMDGNMPDWLAKLLGDDDDEEDE